MEQQQQSLVRSLLKNELTWLFMVIAAVMGFVSQVILPLQRMSLQLTQIQVDLADTKENYQQALKEHQSLTSRIDILETKIAPLIKR